MVKSDPRRLPSRFRVSPKVDKLFFEDAYFLCNNLGEKIQFSVSGSSNVTEI